MYCSKENLVSPKKSLIPLDSPTEFSGRCGIALNSLRGEIVYSHVALSTSNVTQYSSTASDN